MQVDSGTHPAVSVPCAPGQMRPRVGLCRTFKPLFLKSVLSTTDETQRPLGKIIVGNGRDDGGSLSFRDLSTYMALLQISRYSIEPNAVQLCFISMKQAFLIFFFSLLFYSRSNMLVKSKL